MQCVNTALICLVAPFPLRPSLSPLPLVRLLCQHSNQWKKYHGAQRALHVLRGGSAGLAAEIIGLVSLAQGQPNG